MDLGTWSTAFTGRPQGRACGLALRQPPAPSAHSPPSCRAAATGSGRQQHKPHPRPHSRSQESVLQTMSTGVTTALLREQGGPRGQREAAASHGEHAPRTWKQTPRRRGVWVPGSWRPGAFQFSPLQRSSPSRRSGAHCLATDGGAPAPGFGGAGVSTDQPAPSLPTQATPPTCSHLLKQTTAKASGSAPAQPSGPPPPRGRPRSHLCGHGGGEGRAAQTQPTRRGAGGTGRRGARGPPSADRAKRLRPPGPGSGPPTGRGGTAPPTWVCPGAATAQPPPARRPSPPGRARPPARPLRAAPRRAWGRSAPSRRPERGAQVAAAWARPPDPPGAGPGPGAPRPPPRRAGPAAHSPRRRRRRACAPRATQSDGPELRGGGAWAPEVPPPAPPRPRPRGGTSGHAGSSAAPGGGACGARGGAPRRRSAWTRGRPCGPRRLCTPCPSPPNPA